MGHPYFDVVDNSTDFEEKIMRMINVGTLYQQINLRLHSSCINCSQPALHLQNRVAWGPINSVLNLIDIWIEVLMDVSLFDCTCSS